MAGVVDFASKKLEQGPHIAGKLHCLSCKHEWEAIAPVGTTAFECPICGLMRGTHKYLIGADDGITWACHCGNKLFIISTRLNAICISCGTHQSISDA